MSDEEDVEVNVVSEAEDSSNDGKKSFKKSKTHGKKDVGKPNFGGKFGLINTGCASPEMKRRLEEFSERRTDDWLELRGIDFERWRKLSQQTKLSQSKSPSPTNFRANVKTEKASEPFCDTVPRNIELKRIQLSDIRPKTPETPERSKTPGSDRIGKSPERRNFRCSKSRSRSPSPRCRSKSPTSTPNPMYTSFSISNILSRTDSSAKKNSFSGNVQQNLVLDAATNFLSHHPACADPGMLSR